MSGEWKWKCAKSGHLACSSKPLDKIEIDGNVLAGNICANCGCLYYWPTGEKILHSSSIILDGGA